LEHRLPNLYLITDRTQTLGRPLTEVVESALEGGVKIIQLREKDLSGRELFNLAKELRGLTNSYSARLLINDRIDIALAVGADGIHLGGQSISVQDARQAFESSSFIPHPSSVPGTVPILRHDKAVSVNRDSPLIGVSTHSLEEALQAESDGADFITFGPVYFTPSKAAYGEPVGIGRLREVARAIKIPVYALGGVKRDNIEEVLRVGAYGVAMISAIVADNVKKATEDLIKAMTSHQPATTSHYS
jgi:thiamine-phosphate pyrophosphorylase